MAFLTRTTPLWLFLVAILACSNKPAKLEGALGTIPVYAPSSVEDTSSAYTSDDFNNPTKFSTYSWKLRTKDSWEKVDAFYKAQWPSAGRVEDAEEDAIHFHNPPLPSDDAPMGETVHVTILKKKLDGKTAFTLTEDVKSGRRN